MRKLLSWYDLEELAPSADSLDEVEKIMALEEDFGFPIPDELAGQPETLKFRDLVLHRAEKRRAA